MGNKSKQYYEIAPNVEVISNQSHSMYFPPMVSMSNLLDIEYHIQDTDDKNDSANLLFNNLVCDGELFNPLTIHNLLDYSCISDGDVINLALLFTETPKNDEDCTILNMIRRYGIDANPIFTKTGVDSQ